MVYSLLRLNFAKMERRLGDILRIIVALHLKFPLMRIVFRHLSAVIHQIKVI